MRKSRFGQHHIGIYLLVFVAVFAISALVRIRLLGNAPQKLLRADWQGTILHDVSY